MLVAHLRRILILRIMEAIRGERDNGCAMTIQMIQQGIAALRAGQTAEGERFLLIGLRSAEVTGQWRAAACLWLANLYTDQRKGQYLAEAQQADPNNPEVIRQVQAYYDTVNPPAPPIPQAAPPLPGQGGGAYAPVPPPTPWATQPTVPVQPQPPWASAVQNINPIPVQPPPAAPAFGGTLNPGAPGAIPQPLRPVPPEPPRRYHACAVIGGPNGPGSAFFIAREGLLVTTRYVVGGMESVMIELGETRQQVTGRVLRSFPHYDLAFIYVEMMVDELMPITPLPAVPDNTPLIVMSWNGTVVRGIRRPTRRTLGPQWFPTDITEPPDAGGCPIMDDRQYLMGMLTRNTTSNSNHCYGLHISAIRQCLETFRQETTTQRLYCPHCGSYVQAPVGGGHYCEVCGAVTPRSEGLVRVPNPQTARYYAEFGRMPCIHCNAQVGFYNGTCLRCGRVSTAT